MAQNIIYSLWEGTRGCWLCLMTELLLFGLLRLFSFVSECSHFSDSTYSLINVFPQTKAGREHEGRSIGSCSYSKGCMNIKSESHSVVSDSLWPHGLYSPWNSPGQNTGVGSLSFLQIFPTQGSNPALLPCRWIHYQLSLQGRPRTLEWVAYPSSRGSSTSRDQTQVSHIAGGFFTSWATREAQRGADQAV